MDCDTPEGVYPRVTIEYCTQCKWMLRAAYYAQELLSTFEATIKEISLRPSKSGTFRILITTTTSSSSSSSLAPGQTQNTPSLSSKAPFAEEEGEGEGHELRQVKGSGRQVPESLSSERPFAAPAEQEAGQEQQGNRQATESLSSKRPFADSPAPITQTQTAEASGGRAGKEVTKLLWDRKTDGGFPETKELKRRVRDVVEPGRSLGHVDRGATGFSPGVTSSGMSAGAGGAHKGTCEAPCKDCE